MWLRVSSFRHTFRRYLTNQHFGNWSYRHLVCHMGMAVRRQRLRRPVRLRLGQDVFAGFVAGAGAGAVDGFVEHVLFVVVLLFVVGQPNVDGLSQLEQLPSALDMVHIFCVQKEEKFNVSIRREKLLLTFFILCLEDG